MLRLLAVCVGSLLCLSAFCIEIPVALDKRFTLELVAQEPEIVTPTGVAVDARGRIWVIENNTHFTPKNYKGNASDRIKILEDFGPDGRAKKITTFAEGFKNSMSLVLTPDGGVIFATRSEVYSMREKDGVEVAAERKTIMKLDTAGNYPHNGLAGLALGPDGALYFGLGENLGADYKLAGSDGVVLAGGGEGGNVYRCRLDGGKLEKIATGFWNPWGLGFDAAGRLFAVDNDPDSRPPCRLLHVVYGGDYGYKFKYGRKGTHPFQAWNGEIPGTLPMVAGTGEAPCAVFACEAPGLPKDMQGELLVTSWGDHVIQRFKLKPVGESFSALPEVLVKGGVDFRPVGLVPAPDGSLVVTDWVSSSYPVHGKGRVWRIRSNATEKIAADSVKRFRIDSIYSDPGLQKLRDFGDPELNIIISALKTTDPFLFHAAVDALARTQSIEILQKYSKSSEAGVRLGVMLSIRKKKDVDSIRIHEFLHIFLTDEDPRVRRAAIQWVGEERLRELAPQLEKVVQLPMTRDLFEAYLATKSLLSGDKPDKGEYIESQMAQVFPSEKHNAHLRALALKNLRVDHPGIKIEMLIELAADKAPELRAEAIKALALQGAPQAQAELRKLSQNKELNESLRADVIAGLARSAPSDKETQKVLLSFLEEGNSVVLQRETLRALRGAALEENIKKSVYVFAVKLPTNRVSGISELAEQAFFTLRLGGMTANDDLMGAAKLVPRRPGNEIEWMQYLSKPDPNDSVEAGARIFYHVRGALCSGCHRVNGRGGIVGPDLTAIGRTVVREKIVQSILDPARDVAPQFVPWMFILKDGRRVSGTIIEENNGMVMVGENAGASTKLKLSDVELRAPQKGSVMPEQLADSLTQQEMRDLLAFLTADDQ